MPPFKPTVPTSVPASTTSGTLPDGRIDYYNVGKALYNKPVYLGLSGGEPAPIAVNNGQDLEVGKTQTSPEQWSGVDAYTYVQQWASSSVTDTGSYEAIQKQLYDAGFYGSTAPKWGVFTSKDSTAMVDALKGYEGVASTAPITVSEYLDHAAKQGAKQDQTAQTKQYRVNLTDPATIRSAALSAFESAVGKRPSEKQLDSFVQSFQDSQRQAQLSVEQNTAGGEADYSAPSLSGAAMQFAQSADPGAYKQYQAQNYTNALLDMFLPSGSQRTAVTPTPSV